MAGKFKIVLALLAVVLFTSACGDSGHRDRGHNADELYVEHVQVDGRTVTCVVYDDADYEQGGLSCDWSAR